MRIASALRSYLNAKNEWMTKLFTRIKRGTLTQTHLPESGDVFVALW